MAEKQAITAVNTSDVVYMGTTTKSILLKVQGNITHEIHFRIKMTTPMGKLKRSYSERVDVPVETIRFLFDGKMINDTITAQQLEMENGDVVEAYIYQTGGN